MSNVPSIAWARGKRLHILSPLRTELPALSGQPNLSADRVLHPSKWGFLSWRFWAVSGVRIHSNLFATAWLTEAKQKNCPCCRSQENSDLGLD